MLRSERKQKLDREEEEKRERKDEEKKKTMEGSPIELHGKDRERNDRD